MAVLVYKVGELLCEGALLRWKPRKTSTSFYLLINYSTCVFTLPPKK